MPKEELNTKVLRAFAHLKPKSRTWPFPPHRDPLVGIEEKHAGHYVVPDQHLNRVPVAVAPSGDMDHNTEPDWIRVNQCSETRVYQNVHVTSVTQSSLDVEIVALVPRFQFR